MFSKQKSNNKQSTKKLLAAILILSFIVRLIAIFLLGDSKLDHEYATLVPNLLDGRGYSYYSVNQLGVITREYSPNPKIVMPSAFKPPIYSMMVAAFGYLFGLNFTGILIFEIIQAIIGVVTCWLIYDVGRIKFNNQVAILALLIASTFPLLAFASAQISDITLQVFLRCLFYWLLFKLEIQPNSKGLLSLIGVSMGMLLIARTEMWLYLPFIVLWMIWIFKEKWLRLFTPIMLVAMITVAPWVIRNYVQFNTVTLNTSGGLNLWEGQNAEAKGVPSWYTQPRAELSDSAKVKISELEPTKYYEIKLNQIYFDEAKSFILLHPKRVLELGLRKLLFYWGAVYPGVNFTYSNVDSPFYWLPWLLILPFFLYGIILNIRSFKQHFLFHTSFFLSTITVMTFFVLPKYIVFVLPWVFLFVASAITSLINRSKHKLVGQLDFINNMNIL